MIDASESGIFTFILRGPFQMPRCRRRVCEKQISLVKSCMSEISVLVKIKWF